jgi:hypothetical protein
MLTKLMRYLAAPLLSCAKVSDEASRQLYGAVAMSVQRCWRDGIGECAFWAIKARKES